MRHAPFGPRLVVTVVSLAVATWLAGSPVPALAAAPAGAGPVAEHGAVATLGAVASAGCGRPPVPGPTERATPTGDVPMTLTVDGQVRTYRLAVPSTYRSGRPTPLLLLFHGSGSTALQTSLYTGLPAVAARAGMLVATPDAQHGNWMLSRPGASTPDLDFVAALITSLSHRYCVDRHRVVAAGISLGSEFAVVVGCTASLHVAAIGLVAAEYVLTPCSGPLPVLAFHGTADPVVAYANGGTGSDLPGVHVIGVQRNLAGWARIDHCRPRPLRRTVARSVILQTWRGCAGGSSVGLYTIVGGGHTWPGSPIVLPVARFGATTERIDASALLVRFFERAAPRRF